MKGHGVFLVVVFLAFTVALLISTRLWFSPAPEIPSASVPLETNAQARKLQQLRTNRPSHGVPRFSHEAQAKAGYAATRMNEHYEAWLTPDSNPEYTNILTTMQRLTGLDVLSSDLFKDACLYVALQTQVKTFVKKEEEHAEALAQRYGETMANPDHLAKATQSNAKLLELLKARFEEVPGAYHAIFARRFKENHGLDPESVLSELDKLTLHDAGPELRIPDP